MQIRFINTLNDNVFSNLALEHALIQTSADQSLAPIIRLWRNQRCIIMGRGQNLDIEVNQEFCKLNDIKIARRISGGGTVFQDLGNYNLSIFLSPKLKRTMGYFDLPSVAKGLTAMYATILRSLNIADVEVAYDSNLLWKGLKFSGSAGYMYKGWILHHITLLISSNLRNLNKSIKTRDKDPEEPTRSRYFDTTNLDVLDIDLFTTTLKSYLRDKYELVSFDYQVNHEEKEVRDQLLDNLYTTDRWIQAGKRNYSK